MPQLSAEMLAARLAKGKAIPAILLLGEDAYLRDGCRDRIVENSVDPSAREWAVARFSAEDDDLVQILAQARTVPMLVRRQVIIVSDLQAIDQLGEKAREAAADELNAYLDDPAPFTVLLLEATALDQRMRLAKLLGEKTQVVSAQLPQDPEQRVPMVAALAVRMAREQNAELEADAADELADLCNCNLALIRSEIAKLATYVGAGRPISLRDVEALVVSERKSTVWELAEMLASRDRGRALTFVDSLLREGEQPPAMVGAMAWMYRKLIEVQELGPHASPEQAAGRLKMRRTTAAVAVRYAGKIPRSRLVEGLRALYDADSRLKSGGADHQALMEFLVARLIGSDPAVQPR